LTGELANIYKNSGGTDQEIKQVMDSFDSADSEESLKASSDEMESLMASRMGALQGQWKSAFDRPEDKDFPIMNDLSKKVLKGMGYSDFGDNGPENTSSKNGTIRVGKYSGSVVQ